MAQIIHKYFFQDFAFEYKWNLYNFSTCDKPTGKSIKTDVFSSFDQKTKSESKWRLKLYPNGYSTSDSGYISIFLHSMNNFQIKLDCKLIASNSTREYDEQKFSYIFTGLESKCGFNRWIRRNILFNELKVGNDVLTIHCKLDFDNFEPKCPQVNLSKDIGSLLDERQHYDLIIVSNDGREHKAHKAILSCRSNVFAAMLQHDMREKQENLVKIEDVDNETLQEMLYFIYTGKIKNLQKELAKKLFVAADKYQLDDLKEMCTYYLYEIVNNNNVLSLLDFSYIYNISKLKEKAESHFLNNSVAIMASENRDEKMKNLSRQTVERLLHASIMNQFS